MTSHDNFADSFRCHSFCETSAVTLFLQMRKKEVMLETARMIDESDVIRTYTAQ